jgi:hypothetical protein
VYRSKSACTVYFSLHTITAEDGRWMEVYRNFRKEPKGSKIAGNTN